MTFTESEMRVGHAVAAAAWFMIGAVVGAMFL